MTIVFSYKTIKRPDGTEVRTPSIPITLGTKEKIDTIALLDSGADISAIPKDIAEILGLDINKKPSPAYGVGGKVDAIETIMDIAINKGHEHYSFQIPVKVILGKYDFPVLLGRAGFFDRFIVSFDHKKEKVMLKKHTS